jgi:hypothetical protein
MLSFDTVKKILKIFVIDENKELRKNNKVI